tara:strand:+ start:2242 stop:2487 length:246 start_codon:yes stop_codon:yes gene_type:complete
MFNVIDTRNKQVVAQAFTYKEAKLMATKYRRSQYISSKDWQLVAIKKKKEAPIKVYYSDDTGCCDALRDNALELYGRLPRR